MTTAECDHYFCFFEWIYFTDSNFFNSLQNDGDLLMVCFEALVVYHFMSVCVFDVFVCVCVYKCVSAHQCDRHSGTVEVQG